MNFTPNEELGNALYQFAREWLLFLDAGGSSFGIHDRKERAYLDRKEGRIRKVTPSHTRNDELTLDVVIETKDKQEYRYHLDYPDANILLNSVSAKAFEYRYVDDLLDHKVFVYLRNQEPQALRYDSHQDF